jgi:beta-lactam-binding protein with PASTA domain
VFRQIAEQILPDMNVAPDLEIKDTPQLIAQRETPSVETRKQNEPSRSQAEVSQTPMPEVSRSGRDGEVVYAAATRRAIVMPDLRGRSVRDVARTCAQLGLQMEARGDGRVVRQTPAPGAEVSNGQFVYLDFGQNR